MNCKQSQLLLLLEMEPSDLLRKAKELPDMYKKKLLAYLIKQDKRNLY